MPAVDFKIGSAGELIRKQHKRQIKALKPIDADLST
jgi:hypothetical protein